MSLPADQPPSFWDRSIGGIWGGTPTPAEARVVVSTSSPAWEESPDSPSMEFAEQATIRHAFTTDNYAEAKELVLGLKRGTILIDSTSQFSRVLSTSLNYMKGDRVEIVVIAESLMTADVPQDEFGIEPIEFNPSVTKHPRYFIYNPVENPPYKILTPQDIFTVTSQVGSATFWTSSQFETLVSTIPNNDPDSSQTTDAKRRLAAKELAKKMLRGIEAPYVPAFRVTWAQYFFYGNPALGDANVNPQMNPGGYLEDPTEVIPPNFWSIDGSGSAATNILFPAQQGGAMNTVNSPQIYAGGVSWLREADSIYFQRTWFKKTSTWIGAPLGQWDADLYGTSASPYLP